ncbi:hypothetical protein D3218_05515 [Aureimonas flava]|uniref:Uncharacterized protein n=1 Tax=Aureimonas flava TaxID=2320271 RepID=A0A3A1WMS8_9HYPH|nr:hypothetical protein [Aureimonas flava]RIY02867.1 hypothetical protein D3218_05515 [Aureimonas flava]
MRPTLRALCAVLLVGMAPAVAQTVPSPAAPSDGGAPNQAIAPSTDPCAARPADGSGTSLSGQLADCNGVLTPPDTGPTGIEVPVPAPDPGTTPVIPPGAVPDQPGAAAPANPT